MIFIITYFIFYVGIMNKDGLNLDMWAMSVTMFTSVIIVVNLRILITHRLLNILNLLAIFLMSLGLYYSYKWVAHSMNYNYTYMTIAALHSSPLYYLSIFLCTTIAYCIDICIETIKVNMLGRPSQYIRRIVNSYKDLPERYSEEYSTLCSNLQDKFIEKDNRREKYLAPKREK
jgi:steroid 5-alpha reductase family enzyme